MNRQMRMVDTAYYHYKNVNPKDRYVEDCVIRAVANACNQSWEQTVKEMTELGLPKGLLCNDSKLIPLYLKKKGFSQMDEPRKPDNTKMTIKEWLCTRDAHLYHNHCIVANAGSHHTTCIKNGKVEDTWNCSNHKMHKWWVK